MKKNFTPIIGTSFLILYYLMLVEIFIPDRAPCQSLDDYQTTMTLFQNPPAEYSTAPFWVWNYRMTPAIIDTQLQLFKSIGVQQVIIHPRPGLVTEYLSAEWFDLIRHAVNIAKKLDLKILLYDENSYPSGFGGGHVPAALPAVRSKYLRGLKTTRTDTVKQEICCILRPDNETFTPVATPVLNPPQPYRVFYFEQHRPTPWFAGFTYVDILQPAATQKFLETTHEPYKKAIGDEFGKTVLAIFTDEPSPDFAEIPFTPGIFENFSQRYGYDLKTSLPMLIEEVGNYRQVRHDVYGLLLDLMIAGWAQPYSDWCTRNHLPLTGHYWEHAWPHQALCPDNMALNAFSHIPGVDVLCNHLNATFDGQFGNDRMVRETKSVANQMGRKRLLSETYGAAGWDLTFQDMKRIGDWEYALGVNLMNQHLTWSSITGVRKYDHPPSFSYHAPYFYDYKLLADYYARLSAALSQGLQKNQIVLLEPTTSMQLYWRHYRPDSSYPFIAHKLNTCSQAFQRLTHQMEIGQCEYDIASEYLMREYGSIAAKKFVIGQGNYDLFILPPYTENLETKTVDLLEQFLANGGKVLTTHILPEYVAGKASPRVTQLAARYPESWVRVDSITPAEIEKLSPAPMQFTLATGLDRLYHLRTELKDGQLIFLANSDAEILARGQLVITGGAVEVWDPFTGRALPYPFTRAGEKVAIEFELPPAGSLLLCIRREPMPPVENLKYRSEVVPFTDRLSIGRLAPNMLLIDYCDLRLAGKTYPHGYFYDAQKRVYQAHGLPANPWQGIQFKSLVLDTNKFDAASGFEADYIFEVAKGVNPAGMQAVYERPEIFKIKINGVEVAPVPGKWFIDRDFAVYEIGNYVRPGKNKLTVISRPMHVLSELDRAYILGEFALAPQKLGFKIMPAQPLGPGDWCQQGLSLYAGKVVYAHQVTLQQIVGNYEIQLPEWHGACAEVYVNEVRAGIIAFNPYTLDITTYLRPGVNQIKVVVVSTLRNLLGPHHARTGPGESWPSHFYTLDQKQGYSLAGASYTLFPYGLRQDFILVNRIRL